MAVKLLDAATTTGASPRWKAYKASYHTIQADVTGSPTAVTIDLEGSLNDGTYFTLATHPFTSAELTAASAMFHVESKYVEYVKVNVTNLQGGTSPTVTVRYYNGDN